MTKRHIPFFITVAMLLATGPAHADEAARLMTDSHLAYYYAGEGGQAKVGNDHAERIRHVQECGGRRGDGDVVVAGLHLERGLQLLVNGDGKKRRTHERGNPARVGLVVEQPNP